jgi:hypothetical protein
MNAEVFAAPPDHLCARLDPDRRVRVLRLLKEMTEIRADVQERASRLDEATDPVRLGARGIDGHLVEVVILLLVGEENRLRLFVDRFARLHPRQSFGDLQSRTAASKQMAFAFRVTSSGASARAANTVRRHWRGRRSRDDINRRAPRRRIVQ